jgi:hypothetical protein
MAPEKCFCSLENLESNGPSVELIEVLQQVEREGKKYYRVLEFFLVLLILNMQQW